MGAFERSLVAEVSDLKNLTTADENKDGNSTVMERLLAADGSDTKNKSEATTDDNKDNTITAKEILPALDGSDLQKNETQATAHNKKDDNVFAMERSLAMDDSGLQMNDAHVNKDTNGVAVDSSLAAKESIMKKQPKLPVQNKKEDNDLTVESWVAAADLQKNEIKATAPANEKNNRPVSDNIRPKMAKTGIAFDNQGAGPFDATKSDNKKLNIANSSLTNNISVIFEKSDIAGNDKSPLMIANRETGKSKIYFFKL